MKRILQNDKERLDYWRGIVERDEAAYEDQLQKMNEREKLYRGDDIIIPMIEGDMAEFTPYVRNICAELIESQIDSNIPMPKVTPLRREDEGLARLIENMLRQKVNLLYIEDLIDMSERTVKIQGGDGKLCEWDESVSDPFGDGEIAVSLLHPKMIIPQDGVYLVQDMDHITLKIPQTKGYILRRYGIDLELVSESDPDVRSLEGDTAEDMITHYIVYFRNDDGGIGRISYVDNTLIEYIEDYQARRTSKCTECGESEPEEDTEIEEEVLIIEGADSRTEKKRMKICPHCGGTRFHMTEDAFETLPEPITLSDGSEAGGSRKIPKIGEGGEVSFIDEKEKIPFYKPNIFPIVLQKNVSLYGSFLGDSDIDKLSSYQNAIKRIDKKIIDKLLASGSILSLPPKADIDTGNEEMRVVRFKDASEIGMIGVHTLEGAISQDLEYRAQIYEEAKQAIGVTDSYLGRVDRTATSGKAKEFAASQSAGRMESKRQMKASAWAKLYEAIFKFALAYDDSKRPIGALNSHGDREYEEFDRYAFLIRDRHGKLAWNDRFIFSCDDSSALAVNRQAMWEETRANLASGAFGDPTALDTLALFWGKMDELHYPGAGDIKKALEEKLQNQMRRDTVMRAEADAEAALEAQAGMPMTPPSSALSGALPGGMPPMT